MDFVTLATPVVAHFEGCEKKRKGLIYPYLDELAKPAVWTRGYGRTYGISGESEGITHEQAKVELAEGLKAYGLRCLALAPALAHKPECLAAVTSWAWNCGVGAFKASRLRRAINEGRWDDAAQHILRPNTAGGVVLKGLMRRRVAEQQLFMAGI